MLISKKIINKAKNLKVANYWNVLRKYIRGNNFHTELPAISIAFLTSCLVWNYYIITYKKVTFLSIGAMILIK